MTAYEIEKSGIYNATKFTVTLKNGNVIEFWGEYSDGGFSQFFKFNADHNTLQSYYYFDSKGRHDKHITIKGEDILNIKVLINKEEGQRIHENWKIFSYLILGVLILIGLYKSCH